MAAAPVARLDGAAIQIKNLLFVFAGYSTIDYDSMGHSAEGPLPIHLCLILRQSSGGTCPLYRFLVATLFTWNTYWERRAIKGYIASYSDSELRTAKNGQFVKVPGRHVVDLYISDFQSGLRALVKTGSGAGVIPYVDDSIVIDVNPESEELSPEYIGREEPFK
ncbi:unnamed protein product [Prunus brigantina]